MIKRYGATPCLTRSTHCTHTVEVFRVSIWVNVLSLLCFCRGSLLLLRLSFGRPYASRISSIFPFWLVLNTPTAPLQRSKTSPNVCPVYDTKQSDDEVPIMLGLWGMQSTSSSPFLPGQLRPGVGSTWSGPIYGSNRSKLCVFAKLNYLK